MSVNRILRNAHQPPLARGTLHHAHISTEANTLHQPPARAGKHIGDIYNASGSHQPPLARGSHHNAIGEFSWHQPPLARGSTNNSCSDIKNIRQQPTHTLGNRDVQLLHADGVAATQAHAGSRLSNFNVSALHSINPRSHGKPKCVRPRRPQRSINRRSHGESAMVKCYMQMVHHQPPLARGTADRVRWTRVTVASTAAIAGNQKEARCDMPRMVAHRNRTAKQMEIRGPPLL